MLDFLKNTPPLNSVLSGYVAKVLTSRLSSEPLQSYRYIFSHPGYSDLFEKLFCDASITNVTGVLVKENLEKINDDLKDATLKPAWDQINISRCQLFERVFRRFLETAGDIDNLEEHGNLADILLETIENVADLNFPLRTDLLSSVISSMKVANLSSFGEIPSIINKIVSISLKHKQLKSVELNSQDIEELVRVLTANLLQLQKLEGKPLGRKNYQVIEFLDALLALDISTINQAIHRQSTLTYLPQIFLIFPWHNLVHDKIVSIFTRVLRDSNSQLGSQLITEGSLLKVLKDGPASANSVKIKPSYISHFLLICELLINISHEGIRKIIQDSEEWKSIKDDFYLPAINRAGLANSGIRAKKSTEYFEYFFSVEEISERFKKFLQPAELVKEPSLVVETVDPIEPQGLPTTPVKIISIAGRRSMGPEEIGSLLASMSPLTKIAEVAEPTSQDSPLAQRTGDPEICITISTTESQKPANSSSGN